VSTPSAAPRRRPPGRYDDPSLLSQRVLAVVLGGLFIGLLVVIGLLFYGRLTGEQVRGRVIGYDVRSDALVAIDVEVSKPAGSRAYCVVRSRGERGQEVGRDVLVLDAEGTPERTARRTALLATSARAVTGELSGCTTERLTREDVTP